MEIFVYRLLLSVVHQFVYSRQRNSYGLHTEHKKEISTTWFLWQPASMSLMTTVMKDSQEDNRCVCAYCTRNSSCVSQQHSGWAAGAYILLRMWTRANICVERLLTEHRRQQRFCFIADSWQLLSATCISLRWTMHARLYSDLAYVYNWQSSCVLVWQMAPLCSTTPWQALLCNHDNFF